MRVTEAFEAFVEVTIVVSELALGAIVLEFGAIRLADVVGRGRCCRRFNGIVEFAAFCPVFSFRIETIGWDVGDLVA